MNGETILFAGGHYELKGNEVTKYYFAGASRIAVRKYIVPQFSTLTYLAGDHLGSTSLAVDASTGEVIETRYKPWGEVRYTTPSKTLPTRYTFTGQYSYVDDVATDLGAAGFGLMFYNARWYDPALGRFAQADSIVPGGVQGLDRYAYTVNNPVRYIDPTGHTNQAQCNYLKNPDCEWRTKVTQIVFNTPEEAEAFLGEIDSLLWLYDHTYSTDLDVLLEIAISFATDKITGDMAMSLVKKLGFTDLSASAIKALGELASNVGTKELMDIVNGMGQDENTALNNFRDALAGGIEAWKDSKFADEAYMKITITNGSIFSNFPSDTFTVSVEYKAEEENPYTLYDTVTVNIYYASHIVNGNQYIAGLFNGFGCIMENMAATYAPGNSYTYGGWPLWIC